MKNDIDKIGISFIIPCYNAGQYLSVAIDSIQRQPFKKKYEIIIVDDASTDEETYLVLKKVEKEKNVFIIREKNNKGVQHCRNEGLINSKYNFVLVMDSDDCLNTSNEVTKFGTFADRAIDILLASPETAFVHSTTEMFDEYSGFTISAYPISEKLILEKHHVSTWIIYRKEDALGCGLYNPQIKKWQDWSFAVGLINYRYCQGKKNLVSFLSEPYYKYRIHQKTNRISGSQVNESEMVLLTVLRHPEIFRNQYQGFSDIEIATIVIKKKPSKLLDLLYIASNNLQRAIELAKYRDYFVSSNSEPDNIP